MTDRRVVSRVRKMDALQRGWRDWDNQIVLENPDEDLEPGVLLKATQQVTWSQDPELRADDESAPEVSRRPRQVRGS